MNSTNSSASTTVGWAAEPDGRGTTSLLWSCFATIFICTWTVIHPDVPPYKDSDLRVLWTRLKMLAVAIMAPELYTLAACTNWVEARGYKSDLPGWTLRQRFFLTMGGFCVQRDANNERSRVRVTSKDMVQLWKDGYVPWPTISDSDINNFSKADWLTKMIALLQVLWFLAQTIARATEGLAITTLEMFTTGIVLCSILTYIFWWEKPFDVRKPVVLQANASLTTSPSLSPDFSTGIANHPTKSRNFQVFIGICSTTILGALHLAAWQFHFPSLVEKWLWRAASISSICFPLIGFGLLVFLESDDSKDSVYHLIGLYFIILYCFIRLYMLVEMLVGLRDVPTGVYDTVKWSQYFPSFS